MIETLATDLRITLEAGPLLMDRLHRRVHLDGHEIELLPREYALLEFFMRRADQIVTRREILLEVLRYSSSTQTNVVDVHIGRLRRKLDAEGKYRLIATVRGIGFKLETANATPAIS